MLKCADRVLTRMPCVSVRVRVWQRYVTVICFYRLL